MMSRSQDWIRVALRFGTYAACAILSAVSIKTTAFGLALILPGSTTIAYVVSIVLQLIIVSSSWLFFSRATGRIDPSASWFRSFAMLTTCLVLWMVGASFSVAGSFLAFDLRLSDHRALELTNEHEAASLLFHSKVAGQLSERLTFARARYERLAHLRDDERDGRISGQTGCWKLCRGLTDRTLELEGMIARLDGLAAELELCGIDDVACAQNVLDRAVATDPLVGRMLAETSTFLGGWRGDRYLPDDWSAVAFSAPPALPALRPDDPHRLAGFEDLLALRTESLYALTASVGIEVLLLVIACLGVLLVPAAPPSTQAPAPAQKTEPPPQAPIAEPTSAGTSRGSYPPALKSRLIQVANRLTKQGRTIREVAEVLRLPQSTLRRWLGRTPPKLKVLPLEPNAETEKLLGAVARRLYKAGTTVPAISKTLGVPTDVVCTWLELEDEPENDPALGHAV